MQASDAKEREEIHQTDDHFLDSDSDPIVAEYDIFITPQLPNGSQLYWAQYPHRDRGKPYAGTEEPSEVRIKPRSGFLEMDVPVNISTCYDRVRAVDWGEALRETREHGISSFGIAAGFGRHQHRQIVPAPAGTVPQAPKEDRGSVREKHEDRVDRHVRHFNEANETGHVMNKQTLGGQIIRHEDGSPVYMAAAFRGSQLHLTPINGRVDIRPQFHHLDANDRLNAARNRANQSLDGPHSYIISQRNVRVPAGEEELTLQDTNNLLKATADERFEKLKYLGSGSSDAFDDYETMFYPESDAAPALSGQMMQEEYLNWISCPSKRSGKGGYGKSPAQVADDARKAAQEAARKAEKAKRRG